MHCNHRCFECHIPACPERVRQSIGPRIIPMFADPPEWSADKVYSPLTLVIHNGATYMSRRCVPANTALPTEDPFYNESWIMVYDMNAQVAQYREEVAQLSQQVTDFGTKVDSWEQMIVTWTALINNWQNEFPELSKDLSAITERVATLEPQVAQALVDISDLKDGQETQNTQIAANTQNIADLTPRVEAAETHLSALDDEQKVQDDHLNNLDASQLAQDAKIQANTDLATRNQQNINANTAQITENSNNIAKNAAEIANHAEQLEALNNSQSEQDTKIQDNTDSIAQLEADVAQVEATANQAKDSAAHAEAAAAEAQTTATEAKEAAEAASAGLTGQGDRITALETSQGQQDGRLDALEAGQTTQDGKISALETANSQQDTEIQGLKDAQTQQAADIAALKDGTTALPYIKNTGDTVSGAYNFTEAVLTVSEPSNPDDAVNKQYVDDAVSASAGGITPDVTQLKSDVAALQESQAAQDTEIANLKSGATALPYIKNTGDTVTGNYDFTGGTLQVAEPTLPADATTKQYVDNAVSQATDPELTERVTALETSQAEQDTAIASAQSAAEQASNDVNGIKDGTTELPYLKTSGGTVTGAVSTTAEMFNDNDFITKAYLDASITSIEAGFYKDNVITVMKTVYESYVTNTTGTSVSASTIAALYEKYVEVKEQTGNINYSYFFPCLSSQNNHVMFLGSPTKIESFPQVLTVPEGYCFVENKGTGQYYQSSNGTGTIRFTE